MIEGDFILALVGAMAVALLVIVRRTRPVAPGVVASLKNTRDKDADRASAA